MRDAGLTVSAARYRMLSAAGQAIEDGDADVEVAAGAFVLTPAGGDVLRVPLGQIASVAEAEPFTLRVVLAQGTVVELSRLGVMRTQLLAELRDGRADAAAQAAAVVGAADAFAGRAAGERVELRLYDDALLVVGTSAIERVSFSFVQAVDTLGYVVTVQVAGRDPLALSGLGNRTGEFSDELTRRLTAARSRTSAFLGALLPGLDPIALRQAAGLLRDGVAVPTGTLNQVHPDLADSLIAVSALPERKTAVRELAARAELAIGFRQVASVHKEAVGVTPWQDHAATPNIGGHESPGGTFRPGFGGMMAAGFMTGLGPGGFGGGGLGGGGFGAGGLGGEGFGAGGLGPGGPFGFGAGYGGYGDYWAYRALGAGMNVGGQQRPMAQRPDMTRGRLTPAAEDLAALTVAGQDPTVLAFVLAHAPGLVAFEPLNLPEQTTLVFRAPEPGALAVVNRALVDSGFKPPAPQDAGLAAPARPVGQPAALSDLLVGQVPHDANWPSQIAALLST